ncbi:putative ATP-binding protein involved in virulence [Bacteroidales bacterium Barb7]|nr:putative ATP-binding protein involved in virulence [Bacteroidales bacterium Barb7]
MANFSIIALKVLRGNSPNIQKILKEGWYLFNQSYKVENDRLVPNDNYPLKNDFFGKNISISAIVGKNGSGKSCLLDLFFRMAYNLSVKMELFDKINPQFIPLNAEVYFISNNYLYGLKNNDKSIFIFKQEITNNFQIDVSKINWEDEITKKNPIDLKDFFYSIVVNYSIQAYISNDYDDNNTGLSWIDYLFHKNDGYTVPLVFNPKRDDGTVDMDTEYGLSIQRLSALLIKNHDFVDGYVFDSIKLTDYCSKVTSKYEKPNIPISKYSKNGRFKTICKEFNSQYKIGLDLDLINDEYLKTAYYYLVRKSILIARTYNNYKKNKIGKSNANIFPWQFVSHDASKELKKIENLVTQIRGDKSHITLKIRQVVNFLQYAEEHPNSNLSQIEYNYLLPTDESEIKKLSLDQIIEKLPPPFYKQEIIFKKNENTNSKEAIIIRKMSSGERQFLFSMSTVLYHIKNMMSVPENDKERVKYKNFNIVLDEIELCFHPEYQREFVNKLIGYLERLVGNDPNKEDYHFNIILVTHSPFILSDIPKCNVLFLKEGRQCDEMQEDTFGANIHSLLQNAFFLNGTIGEFAKQKINKMFKQLYNGEIDENLYTEIKLVSEPFIRSQLLKLYKELVPNKKLEKEINELRTELIELKKQINDKDK